MESGQSVVLVGPSGCGKSTIMQLLLRFYKVKNAEFGSVSLNGVDVNELDAVAYRKDIALVQQEPLLFNMSITRNIVIGVGGIVGREEPSMKEIVEAAKQANAHNFIMEFPNGYDTIVVGNKGLH